MRETRSTLPPGGNDTTQRIGLLGQSCALAAVTANSAAKKTALIRPPLVIVRALQLLQPRAHERLAGQALAVVEDDLVGLARHGAARAAEADEIFGGLHAVRGLAQVEAQVVRGLGCGVWGAVADEFRVPEPLDRRDELLDLARLDRRGRRCRRAGEKRQGDRRQDRAHQDCMYPLSSGVV